MADAQDLKSWDRKKSCGFESHHRHHSTSSKLSECTNLPGRLTVLFRRGWRWNVSGPGHSGFWFVLGGLARHGWDVDQVIASGALDLPARVLFVTRQMLTAVGTFKFEFAHNGFLFCNRVWTPQQATFFSHRTQSSHFLFETGYFDA